MTAPLPSSGPHVLPWRGQVLGSEGLSSPLRPWVCLTTGERGIGRAKRAVVSPRRYPFTSVGTKPANPLVLGFQPPGLRDINSCCLSPGVWPVVAAPAHCILLRSSHAAHCSPPRALASRPGPAALSPKPGLTSPAPTSFPLLRL